MGTERRLIDCYYVVRNKNTGFYFRGKGANRWGEYHNQASIYRIKAHAENTANWLNLRGEPVEIVPIKIIENPAADVVEVVRCKNCVRYNTNGCADGFGWCEAYDNGRMDNDYCSFGSDMDEAKFKELLFADMEEIIDATD